MVRLAVSGSSIGSLDELARHEAHVSEAASAPSSKAGARERNSGIDALRAAVTLLVVLHHTALTYGAIGGWYYREIAPSGSPTGLLLILFCTTNQAWFMGLFFLLAGYYTPPAHRRRGTAGFIRERLTRLGIPLVFYSLILSPLTIALAGTAKGRSFVNVLTYVWSHGRLEAGPLWFAEALLIFSATWLAWQAMRKGGVAVKSPFPSGAVLLSRRADCLDCRKLSLKCL